MASLGVTWVFISTYGNEVVRHIHPVTHQKVCGAERKQTTDNSLDPHIPTLFLVFQAQLIMVESNIFTKKRYSRIHLKPSDIAAEAIAAKNRPEQFAKNGWHSVVH